MVERTIEPWETKEGEVIWKNSSQYFNWLRGAIRRVWADNPMRKEWKKQQLRPVTKAEKESKVFHSSTKNVGQCYLCGDWMAGSKLEVDHLESSDGCKNWDEAHSFLEYCSRTIGEQWALACKPCHKIKTYSERQGISFEEALLNKKAIAIINNGDKEWLEERGVTPARNATLRREQVIDTLRGEL